MSRFILNSLGKPFLFRPNGQNIVRYNDSPIIIPTTTTLAPTTTTLAPTTTTLAPTTTTTTIGGANWNMDQHLPAAGLSILTDTSWPTVTPSPWSEVARQGSPQTIITDGSAPTGGTTVLRQNWTGVADGQSPYFCYVGTTTTREFGSIVMRLDAAFDVPGEMKWLTWLPAGGGFIWFGIYRGNATYGVQGAPTSQINFRYVQRGQPGGSDRVSRFDVADANTPIPKNAWFKFSWELDFTTPNVRAWLNSTLIIDMARDGMIINTGSVPVAAPTTFSFGTNTSTGEFQQGSTWGGGNGITAGSNIVIDYARTAIWTA